MFSVLFLTLSNICRYAVQCVFDNMVLQRNTEVILWGWANPQEEVVITPSWNNQTYKIKASNQAKWEINIPTPKECWAIHYFDKRLQRNCLEKTF